MRSASHPDTPFMTDAAPSATPSMRPSTDTGAPSTPVMNRGRTGYSISEAASWKKLTHDRTTTFRLSRRPGSVLTVSDGSARAYHWYALLREVRSMRRYLVVANR